MHKDKDKTAAHGKRGIAILISVLVASVVLSIGISILNITLKEFLISATARDSEYAFYAADAGMECALYWDKVQKIFDRDTGGSMNCMEVSVGVGTWSAVSVLFDSDNDIGWDFYSFDDDGGWYQFQWGTPAVCARITVWKEWGGATSTRIVSRGYNRGCNELDGNRVVERALRIRY